MTSFEQWRTSLQEAVSEFWQSHLDDKMSSAAGEACKALSEELALAAAEELMAVHLQSLVILCLSCKKGRRKRTRGGNGNTSLVAKLDADEALGTILQGYPVSMHRLCTFG